jgi:hypothetical protein
LKVPGLPVLILQAKVWDPFVNLGTEFGHIEAPEEAKAASAEKAPEPKPESPEEKQP